MDYSSQIRLIRKMKKIEYLKYAEEHKNNHQNDPEALVCGMVQDESDHEFDIINSISMDYIIELNRQYFNNKLS